MTEPWRAVSDLPATMPVTALVPLAQLAEELGVGRSNARKIALTMGVVPVRRQMLELGHRQRTLCWTREQADAILATRRADGFEAPGCARHAVKAMTNVTAPATSDA